MKIAKLIPAPYRVAAGVASVILAVVLAAYFVSKFNRPDFNQVKLPTTSGGTQLTQAEAQKVRSLAMRLHEDMDGLAVPGFRDKEAYEELLDLTDPLFVAVYNDFGVLYFSEGNGTLRDWIDAENFSYTFSIFTPWGIATGNAVKDEIFDRMNALNLQ
jgi:hypothetical protein